MTAVLLFTRDLRVHDHPALTAAVESADEVVPLFVLDDDILAMHASPNRRAFLLAALRDLRGALVERGGSLVVRRGRVLDEVAAVCREVGASSLRVSEDIGIYAQRRSSQLAGLADELGIGFHEHPGVTVVPPGELAPSGGGDVYQVFTPYYRAWRDHPLRAGLAPPTTVRLPAGLATGRLPGTDDFVGGAVSPRLPVGGETAGRQRLDDWLQEGIEDYGETRDRLAVDGTSMLSPHLHFGCLSPREILGRLDLRRRGHEPFARQLAWRDFHHQTTWSHPRISALDYRPRGDEWRDDQEALTAWKDGRTGYPVVDAAMRQLREEGWIHNRARMIAASFLTKHLLVDWRRGAEHFLHWLVDGDVANNSANWQWVAGTGTDTRPNRMLNPTRQAERYDSEGAYVRRYVPELRSLDAGAIHRPWERPRAERQANGYPPPVVAHDAARQRFLAWRS
ncbi:MAG: deoxyribodipyrimidine photo-lyase [Nitriliruptorales bacterium]|nr:deoxyribodipyrimidine photo-lyase [Nitriliruptorales bacterium]